MLIFSIGELRVCELVYLQIGLNQLHQEFLLFELHDESFFLLVPSKVLLFFFENEVLGGGGGNGVILIM